MKKSLLFKLSDLSRNLDEFYNLQFDGVRRKHIFYIVIWSTLLILVSLNYAQVIDVGSHWKIKGYEKWIALFCLFRIFASIWTFTRKKYGFSIKGYKDFNDIEAKKEIVKLIKTEKRAQKFGYLPLLGTIFTVIFMLAILYISFEDPLSSKFFLKNVLILGDEQNLVSFIYTTSLIFFLLGSFIGKPFFYDPYKRRERRIEIKTRNLIISSLNISNLNPELNE